MYQAKNWQEIRRIRSLKKERKRLTEKIVKVMNCLDQLNKECAEIDRELQGEINSPKYKITEIGTFEKASIISGIRSN